MIRKDSTKRVAGGAACAVVLCFVAVVALTVFGPTPDAAAGGMPKPPTHDGAWRTGHATFAKGDVKSCYACHDQSYCTSCHNSDNPKEAYHKTNYRYTHYLDKFMDEKECATCHDRQEFCVSCHEDTAYENNAGRPPSHIDPGWTTSGHAEVAPAEIDTCASCHDVAGTDPVCISCHRGINPHGNNPITEADKGPWDKDTSYVCYKCHDQSFFNENGNQ